MRKTKLTGDAIGAILTEYLNDEPDKMEICPLIMILLDYYTDDHSEHTMTAHEFLNDAMRKRSMLQALIEEWRKN